MRCHEKLYGSCKHAETASTELYISSPRRVHKDELVGLVPTKNRTRRTHGVCVAELVRRVDVVAPMLSVMGRVNSDLAAVQLILPRRT